MFNQENIVESIENMNEKLENIIQNQIILQNE